MKIIKINIDSVNFEFICTARDTRSGFAHDCTLFIDNREFTSATCHYINRTWESWSFQSVCKNAIYHLIMEEIDNQKKAFKAANNIKRMTQARLKDFNEALTNDNYLKRLKLCADDLTHNYH